MVKHGVDETRLLRNVGFDVPAPILSHYDFEGGTPFDVQRKTCTMLNMNSRAYVLNARAPICPLVKMMGSLGITVGRSQKNANSCQFPRIGRWHAAT